jgi:hypothetical protein
MMALEAPASIVGPSPAGPSRAGSAVPWMAAARPPSGQGAFAPSVHAGNFKILLAVGTLGKGL